MTQQPPAPPTELAQAHPLAQTTRTGVPSTRESTKTVAGHAYPVTHQLVQHGRCIPHINLFTMNTAVWNDTAQAIRALIPSDTQTLIAADPASMTWAALIATWDMLESVLLHGPDPSASAGDHHTATWAPTDAPPKRLTIMTYDRHLITARKCAIISAVDRTGRTASAARALVNQLGGELTAVVAAVRILDPAYPHQTTHIATLHVTPT